MMLKITGCLIIIVTGALLGFGMGEKYLIREQILNDITVFLRNLKNNVMYKKDTTAQAIYNAAFMSNFKKLHFFTNYEEGDNNFPQTLKTALYKTENKIKLYLLLNETECFKNTLLQLGTTNTSEEIEKLNFSISFFEEALQNAKIQTKIQLKLYKSLGLAGGIGVAILFL